MGINHRPGAGCSSALLASFAVLLAVAATACADDEPIAGSSPSEVMETPAVSTGGPPASTGESSTAEATHAGTPGGTHVTAGKALRPHRSVGHLGAGLVAPCTTAHLEISAGTVDAGAGQRYLPIVFRNTGSTSCTLSGYPGVQGFSVDAAPTVTATHETGAPVSTVTLAVGGSASSVVHATSVEGESPCLPDFRFLYVTPPGQSTSATVKVDLPACGGLRVRAIVPGTTGQ